METEPPHGTRVARLREALSKTRLDNPARTDSEVGAVVGVLLVENHPDELEVLLVQRVEREGDPWSGHIGFPGGRVKPSDRSLLEACRREVVEEVGIDLEKIDPIGTLSSSYPSNRPELKVQPYVFLLTSPPGTIILGEEIVDSFWVSLSRLSLSRGSREVSTRIGKRMVDSYLVHDRIVWGFTFRVLEELLKLDSVPSS